MKNIGSLFLIVLFALILAVPIFKINLAQNKISETEKRYLANFPFSFDDEGKINVAKGDFENWLNDNIGLREMFVNLSTKIKFHDFNQKSNDKVEQGKDDWYFFKLDNNIEIAKGNYDLNGALIENIVKKHVKIKEKLERQGIEYVFVLPPSKVSIYPEYIASADCGIIATPVDIIADSLEKEGVKVIRLKQNLIEAKKDSQVYFKTDTHWNETGAYVAYKKIINDLNKFGIIKNNPAEAEFYEAEYEGEFSAMLGKAGILPKEKTMKSQIVNKRAQRDESGERFANIEKIKMNNQMNKISYVFHNDFVDDKKILIFGDSMFGGWNMPELMAENFSELTYIWDYNINQNFISETKPDIVMYEVTERCLGNLGIISMRAGILENPNAEIISTDMPLEIERGESYDVHITVKNTTEQAWSEVDMVRLCIWQEGQDFGFRVNLPDGVEVEPEEEYTFTLEGFSAPPLDNTYVEFQMLQEGIQYFGEKYRVDVLVK